MVQSGFASGANSAGVIDIFSQVRAMIDARDDQIRLLRQEFVKRNNHAVRGRAINGPLALGDVVANNRLTKRQRLRRAALFGAWRHDANGCQILQYFGQPEQSGGLIAIIVGQENVSHSSRETLYLREMKGCRSQLVCAAVVIAASSLHRFIASSEETSHNHCAPRATAAILRSAGRIPPAGIGSEFAPPKAKYTWR